MTPQDLIHLRRARDLMDRAYAQFLDVPVIARTALMSPAHFSRQFRTAHGETPYGYPLTRRIERAKGGMSTVIFVTDDCDAIFEQLRAAGAEVLQEPIDQPSGVRDCSLRDLPVTNCAH